MTHIKNIEAFTKLIGFCNGYGTLYNPGSPNLRMDALLIHLNKTQEAIEQVRIVKNNLDNLVNHRKQAFNDLPALISSILRTLEASGAKPEKLKNARMFVHQLIGSSPRNRAPIPSGNDSKPEVQHAKLQLAFVSRVDAFSMLVKAVSSEPLYQWNERDFNPTELEEKIHALNNLNKDVEDARALWRKALIERNEVMYNKEVSMTKTAWAVKKYVRAIFGLHSEHYILLKRLVFTMPTKH
ncbi:MAG TPA: hypothetical protein PLJ60_19650 [Chryseolinea sp.]|nr:hypothetical protein [Chryseolinea sp.]HPM32558.1 hypothetical protein [Chryseolinea sp.]